MKQNNLRSGQIVVFMVFFLTTLVAICGLVIDVGMIQLDRQEMKKAADSSALAAARALKAEQKDTALLYAKYNGFDATKEDSPISVIVDNPVTDNATGKLRYNWLRTTITKQHKLFFGGIIKLNQITLKVFSTAQYNTTVPISITLTGEYGAIDPTATISICGRETTADHGDPISSRIMKDFSLNPRYDPDGYYYTVNIPAGVTYDKLMIELWDAAANSPKLNDKAIRYDTDPMGTQAKIGPDGLRILSTNNIGETGYIFKVISGNYVQYTGASTATAVNNTFGIPDGYYKPTYYAATVSWGNKATTKPSGSPNDSTLASTTKYSRTGGGTNTNPYIYTASTSGTYYKWISYTKDAQGENIPYTFSSAKTNTNTLYIGDYGWAKPNAYDLLPGISLPTYYQKEAVKYETENQTYTITEFALSRVSHSAPKDYTKDKLISKFRVGAVDQTNGSGTAKKTSLISNRWWCPAPAAASGVNWLYGNPWKNIEICPIDCEGRQIQYGEEHSHSFRIHAIGVSGHTINGFSIRAGESVNRTPIYHSAGWYYYSDPYYYTANSRFEPFTLYYTEAEKPYSTTQPSVSIPKYTNNTNTGIKNGTQTVKLTWTDSFPSRNDSPAFDPSITRNGTVIMAEGPLPLHFSANSNDSVEIKLGYVPESAAGVLLHVNKFDADVGSTYCNYYYRKTVPGDNNTPTGNPITTDGNGREFPQGKIVPGMAGDELWLEDQIPVPEAEHYDGGIWYAQYATVSGGPGMGDNSYWEMWYEGMDDSSYGVATLVE